jgi:uncharacterized protein (TIGR03083 family)
MSQATIKDVTTVPRIAHGEAMQIAAAENAKFATLLRSLEPGDWAKPTDCTLWDARAVAAHVVGSAAGQASPREFARQVRKGRPLIAEIGGQYWWDGMNQLQIRERAGLSTGQLITEWDVASARALRARTRLPRPIARLPLLNLPAPVGRQPLSYLFDIGFTRDVWMHRIDLARATGKTLDQDPGHDSPSPSPSTARPEGSTAQGPAVSTSTWTPSSSAGSCPDAARAPASCATPFPSSPATSPQDPTA